MGESNLTTGGSKSLLDKGMEILKDPNSSKAAKAAAVGTIAIAGIAVVAKETLNVISQDK